MFSDLSKEDLKQLKKWKRRVFQKVNQERQDISKDKTDAIIDLVLDMVEEDYNSPDTIDIPLDLDFDDDDAIDAWQRSRICKRANKTLTHIDADELETIIDKIQESVDEGQ